jgi:hypothetical protein
MVSRIRVAPWADATVLVTFLVTAVGLVLAFGAGFRPGQPWLYVAILIVGLGVILAVASGAWLAYRILRTASRPAAAPSRSSWSMLLLPLGFLVMLVGSHAMVTRPELYRTCTSSDDGLVLNVYRAITPPYVEGVDVIVTVEAADGRRVCRRVIDNRDMWNEVDTRYSHVLCEKDRFVVGPEWWNGSRMTDFVLAKSALAAKN